ncbi:expressed unknown protein [Seminavis robusta]|uniref:Uncharacterized protein n=1 Tax=Seminavis robusta TaxID=568900 RepID=A0A9N8ESE5_9STRA|nr:expressed unknown protein [Seminavis robusta]|eukprot:Sro1512_g278800.1 n/a (639) ;mRNA; r:10229-12691
MGHAFSLPGKLREYNRRTNNGRVFDRDLSLRTDLGVRHDNNNDTLVLTNDEVRDREEWRAMKEQGFSEDHRSCSSILDRAIAEATADLWYPPSLSSWDYFPGFVSNFTSNIVMEGGNGQKTRAWEDLSMSFSARTLIADEISEQLYLHAHVMTGLQRAGLIGELVNGNKGLVCNPDFWIEDHRGKKRIAIVGEAKSTHNLPLPMGAHDIVNQYNDAVASSRLDPTRAQILAWSHVGRPVSQLIGYMILNRCRYGMLTSATRTYFLYIDNVDDADIVRISDAWFIGQPGYLRGDRIDMVDFEEIDIRDPIGYGKRGTSFSAQWKDELLAVKVFDATKPGGQGAFEKEIKAHLHLEDAWGQLIPEPRLVSFAFGMWFLGMQMARPPPEGARLDDWGKVPLDVVEGSEGEEEEEELPVEIQERVYSEGEKGELELLEDLKKHGLEDYDCHVDLDDEGRTHLRIPTDVHQMAVKAMEYRFTDGQSEPLCTDRDPNVRVTKGPKKKNPDLAVWGKERLNKFKVPKTVGIGGNELFKPRMNPHVIIEFSWTNKLKEKEIPKFNRQMKDNVADLGQINLGFLFKAKAANGKELAKEEEAASVPLCGYDVYKAESGEQLTPGQPPFLQYRIGVHEDASITIPGVPG